MVWLGRISLKRLSSKNFTWCTREQLDPYMGGRLLRVNKEIKPGCTTNPETEAVLQGRSEEKMFWLYADNLQENTHVEEWFQ